MNVQRAIQVVPPEAIITAECRTNHYGGAWCLVARMDDGYERALTQFAEPFSAAHWMAEYDRARRACSTCGEAWPSYCTDPTCPQP